MTMIKLGMLRSPHIFRHILGILMMSSILIPVVIIYSKDKPFSKVFHLFNPKDRVKNLAKRLNSERLFKAKQYLESLNKTIIPNYNKQPELVIVIVTVKRTAYDMSNLGYVLQTVAATHKIYVKDKVFPNKTMMICNVDINPLNYTDVDDVKLYIPVVERYGSSSLPVRINDSRKDLYANKRYTNKYNKETIDYMYCLETAYSLGAKYVLLMEDDSLPREDMLDVVHSKIKYLHTKPQPFSYIKLYYPQRWQGYGYETTRILEIICIGCVGAGIVVACHFILCKSNFYFIQLAYFLCGAWMFVLACMIMGRQNLYEFYRLSKYLYTLKPSPGCCTQAMLYSSHILPELIDFLSAKHKGLHTDLAIYNFTNITGYPAYQVEPNLFYHVGMYTSLTSDTHKNAEEFLFDAL